jgi:hypothetical protein|tara:strand:+ start:1934 stop:2155 length:222 start_codon:yes stop_codon:yes gene_type:complete
MNLIEEEFYIPVEGNSGLCRDSRSGAIINTNKNAAQQAREARVNLLNKEEELKTLKSDVHEIKSLLNQLLERL